MIPSFIIPHPSILFETVHFVHLGISITVAKIAARPIKSRPLSWKIHNFCYKDPEIGDAVQCGPLWAAFHPPSPTLLKSWSLSSPCLPLRVIIFSLIGGSQHLQSVSKSNGGQVALAVASHHGIIVQEPIFLGSSNPKGERKGWRRIGGETSRRSEFIVPDLIENLPLGKSKFLPGSFFFFVDLERMRVDVVMERGKRFRSIL